MISMDDMQHVLRCNRFRYLRSQSLCSVSVGRFL